MNFDDLNTPGKTIGWDFIVLMSRQGKIRLAEFFSSYTESDKRRILRDIAADVLPRAPKMCNIIEKGEYKVSLELGRVTKVSISLATPYTIFFPAVVLLPLSIPIVRLPAVRQPVLCRRRSQRRDQ
jgi:hypothetical protein